MGHITRVQQKMLDILSDGMPHSKEELHTCLSDDLGPITNIRAHLCMLRKVLRPIGQDIVCEYVHWKSLHYRQIRLLASANNGRK